MKINTQNFQEELTKNIFPMKLFAWFISIIGIPFLIIYAYIYYKLKYLRLLEGIESDYLYYIFNKMAKDIVFLGFGMASIAGMISIINIIDTIRMQRIFLILYKKIDEEFQRKENPQKEVSSNSSE